MIFFGILLSILGFICLLIFKKKATLPWRHRTISGRILLMVSNFGLAFIFILIIAKTWEHGPNSYSITAFNQCTRSNIKTLKFLDPTGHIHPFESVAREEKITHRYRFKGEGAVKYFFTQRLQGSQSDLPEQSGILLGYISDAMDVKMDLQIKFHDSDCPPGSECSSNCTVTVF